MSKSLVPSHTGLLITGGIAAFESDCLEPLDVCAKRIISLQRITEINDLPKVYGLIPFVSHVIFMAFIQQLVAAGLLDKKGLTTLYLMQDEECRQKKPFLGLSELSSLGIFTTEDVVNITLQVGSVSEDDVVHLLESRGSRGLLTEELLKEWLENSRHRRPKANLLIALELCERGVVMDVEHIHNALRTAVETSPNSGAVQKCITLLYSTEKPSKRRRDASKEHFADAICEMIRPTAEKHELAFHGAMSLLGWYLANPHIRREDREWVEDKVNEQCKVFQNLYGNFVSFAKSNTHF